MAKAFLKVRAFVNNCPVSIIRSEDRVMVARLVDSELWFYGLYATWDRAEEVAKELGNGVVLEVETEDTDGTNQQT
jgi:hypothetical protein